MSLARRRHVLGVLSLALFAACRSAPLPPPSRIVLFSLDSVRADRLDPRVAPELAAIAEEGVWFRDFHAAATYTLPSHMSIFTGLDPAEHGVLGRGSRLPEGIETLPERLRRAGYRTQGFHEGGFVAARFGFDRGFEDYRDLHRGELVQGAREEVLAWLRSFRNERWFLFLHTYNAHFPYGGFRRYRAAKPDRGLPDDEELERLRRRYAGGRGGKSTPRELRILCTLYNFLADPRGPFLGCGGNEFPSDFARTRFYEDDLAEIRRSYDERVREIDRLIGDIRDVLRELGRWEDTLLVVTSDHGEALFEHGRSKHGAVPFEEVVHVPLVISYPQGLRNRRGPRAIRGLAWHLDLAPTILRLAGLAAEPSPGAMDLAAVLSGEAEIPPARAIFPAVLDERHPPGEPPPRVVLEGALKLHALDGARSRLFDLQADPGERIDLASARPEDRARLRALLEGHLGQLRPRLVGNAESPPVDATPTPTLPDEEAERLRSLGYLQ